MNPRVTSFPALIRWIADKYHDGAVLPIAGKVGISPALVNLWVKGQTKNPAIENLERLCDAYSLDFDFVRSLLRRRQPPPISGGSGSTESPPGAVQLRVFVTYQNWLNRAYSWLARPLLVNLCPA